MQEGHAHLTDMTQLGFFVLDEADRMVQQGHFQVRLPCPAPLICFATIPHSILAVCTCPLSDCCSMLQNGPVAGESHYQLECLSCREMQYLMLYPLSARDNSCKPSILTLPDVRASFHSICFGSVSGCACIARNLPTDADALGSCCVIVKHSSPHYCGLQLVW